MDRDYPSVTFACSNNNERRHLGEYRTCRLVLEAWDRMMGLRYHDRSPNV